MKKASLFTLGAIGAAFSGACTAPGGPDNVKTGFAAPDAGVTSPDATMMVTSELRCNPVASSQVYPPRASVLAGDVSSGPQVYFTSDLYARFKSVCGGCHVDGNNGGFSVNADNFGTMVTQAVVDTITSKDPKVWMPPSSVQYDQRPDDDPSKQLVVLLEDWINAGSPDGTFPLPQQGVMTSGATYMLPASVASAMTNLGTCVPGKGMIGTETSTMDKLDAFFASATTLPTTLDKTDLVTLDSDELARSGVISFAPAYPLWTENAGKMRYVRVPRGQSIAFDKVNQRFQIPPNTRFYKTFLKQVTDVSGHLTWRKMETRLIVSRPDQNGPDGRAIAQTALYGTYIWSDDETTATLLNDPLRNGKPFSDRIVTYITDEQKAKAISDTHPNDLQRSYEDAGIVRHYAFPGAIRCVDCHMGSVSQSFVLGFNPIQLARRPSGTGGLYEPASGDELTQLQRLIDYGVITGMTSPDDVLPLELQEGTRSARTPEELDAQAYMVGNCSHCHNPRGFPSIKQPLLADKLNFYPSPTGGIFQFPLDRVSPIRHRGLEQDVPVPYITPSLYDQPRDGIQPKAFCPDGSPNGDCWDPNAHTDPVYLLAPWRSLVYRNVSTPFDYFEDYVPFPHMPLNSPGYDCRAAGIMGDWMVSIPSKLVDTTHPEAQYPGRGGSYINVNTDIQPYAEVTPDSPDYPQALADARDRLAKYHAGPEHGFCPTTYTADIVDPVVTEEVNRHEDVKADTGSFAAADGKTLIMPDLGIPIRPNYFTFDDTDPAGPWFPRNPLWDPGLIDPTQIATVVMETLPDSTQAAERDDLSRVLTELQTIKLTDDVRKTLLAEVPSGLWDTSDPTCDFSSQKKVSDFTGSDRPAWFDVAKPPPSAPVFVQSAGAAVFTTICFNCHGVQADSKGLLADAIINLTGGDARVADFRDGLFGPVSNPGANRTSVFGDAATKLGLTPDDLTVRYMAYMALGGTQKHLPVDVLREVAQAPVFGKLRDHLTLLGSPDMLQLGLAICGQIAMASNDYTIPLTIFRGGRIPWSQYTGLIDTSGDAEMWLKLCNLNNRPIVRVPLVPKEWSNDTVDGELEIDSYSLYWGDAKAADGTPLFPADAPVMDDRGRIHQGLTADNPYPICVVPPSDPQFAKHADDIYKSIKVPGTGATPPYCPPGFATPANQLSFQNDTFPDAQRWAARGTISAAMAVFLYLDEIERDPSKRQPLYNQCQLLGASQ